MKRKLERKQGRLEWQMKLEAAAEAAAVSCIRTETPPIVVAAQSLC